MTNSALLPVPPSLPDGFTFDPERLIVTDGETDIPVSLQDGVIVTDDGESFGAYDPELVAEAEEAEDAVAPVWAERMVDRLARHAVRAELLSEELARIDARCSKRVAELTETDEEFRTLSLRRDHMRKLSVRNDDSLSFLTRAYSPVLQTFAEARLKGQRRRTFDLLAGSLSLRTVPARIVFDKGADDGEVVEALEALGETSAISKRPLMTGLSQELTDKLLAGEATVTGFVLRPARQELKIKAGGGTLG